MKLVDAHCHLECEEFAESLDDVMADAARAGIVRLITSSIIPEQWPISKSISERYPEAVFAWGVHPWYIRPEHESRLPELKNAVDAGASAIGEIGLDKKTELVPIALQTKFFEIQLRVAKDLDLPVVIHCRAAFDVLLPILKRIGVSRTGAVMHNYSGGAELARQLSDLGLSFSFGGALTFRNSKKKREVLRAVYPERILLETDSPDLPPVEARERPNVPANILYNLRAASDILEISEIEIAEVTTLNAARIFRFDQAVF
jgi:TatD DNase family protein